MYHPSLYRDLYRVVLYHVAGTNEASIHTPIESLLQQLAIGDYYLNRQYFTPISIFNSLSKGISLHYEHLLYMNLYGGNGSILFVENIDQVK